MRTQSLTGPNRYTAPSRCAARGLGSRHVSLSLDRAPASAATTDGNGQKRPDAAVIDFFTTAGYYLAAFMLAVFPAAVLFWLLIHPFARFWRRRGPWVAYPVISVVCLALAWGIFRLRGPLLAVRWPFSWWLAGLGVVVYLVALWIEIQCRRYLGVRTLVGAPELGKNPGKVLTEGIYTRLRHPRYLAVVLGVIGWALLLNYPAIWVLALLVPPGFLLVIHLEERELRDRFGAEYEEYMRAVPNRLIPRLGR
jgi:protein-S-isoprenylcysteine O-methyltransferase Ste14